MEVTLVPAPPSAHHALLSDSAFPVFLGLVSGTEPEECKPQVSIYKQLRKTCHHPDRDAGPDWSLGETWGD